MINVEDLARMLKLQQESGYGPNEVLAEDPEGQKYTVCFVVGRQPSSDGQVFLLLEPTL